MADFAAQTTPSLPHESGRTAAQLIDENDGLGSGGPTAQRIYDTGNSVWVYYAPTPITDAPAPGDTTPNHSGALDASSHQVI
jgi:hypothetical protein